MLTPLLAMTLLLGCSRDDLYSDATFTENVYQAYADCDPSEIKFLAAKHNLQLAFDACGSNRFAHFAWSPDGINLYFQLTHGGHVMNAEEKTISTIPSESPSAAATWLRPDLLVLPLGPADATTDEQLGKAVDTRSPYRLAWYDLSARTLNVLNLDVRDPKDLQPWGEGDTLLMTAIGDDGQRHPYLFDPVQGKAHRALEWLDQPMERLSYAPDADLLAWSTPQDTELMRISDHSSVALLPGVTRAIPHPHGRYVALETLGEPVSLFDQRSWNELSEDARKRELKRKEEWLQQLPEWAPKEVQPPELQVLDLDKDQRYRITAFNGDQFQWYQAQDYFCSFIMWGIESKQLHRNVALTDLAERLRMLDKGEVPLGIEPWTPEPSATAPATATPATATPAPEPPAEQ